MLKIIGNLQTSKEVFWRSWEVNIFHETRDIQHTVYTHEADSPTMTEAANLLISNKAYEM